LKDASQKLLKKAGRAIHAAEALQEAGVGGTNAPPASLAVGEPDFACGRAYYAMFYSLQALLFENGIKFRKHGSVHSALAEHFTRKGIIEARFHQMIVGAYEDRITGDYGVEADFEAADARERIENAREFLGMVMKNLRVQ